MNSELKGIKNCLGLEQGGNDLLVLAVDPREFVFLIPSSKFFLVVFLFFLAVCTRSLVPFIDSFSKVLFPFELYNFVCYVYCWYIELRGVVFPSNEKG